MKTRQPATTRLATAFATALATLAVCPLAAAQIAATDAPIAAPAAPASPDAVTVSETPRGTAPARERGNLFVGAGVASVQSFRMVEAGRTYSAQTEAGATFAAAGCLRWGPTCFGWVAQAGVPQRVRLLEGQLLQQTVKLSSYDHGPFVRVELGSRVRFRPQFGLVFGDEQLEFPTAKFKGSRVDARLSLDLALPLGAHALVVQAGVNASLVASGMTAENTSVPTPPIDVRREPASFLMIGPEFRLLGPGGRVRADRDTEQQRRPRSGSGAVAHPSSFRTRSQLNGDKRADLLWIDRQNDAISGKPDISDGRRIHVRLASKTKPGSFEPETLWPIELGDAWAGQLTDTDSFVGAFDIGDVTGDGHPDLVHTGTFGTLTNSGPKRTDAVFVKPGRGDGTFAELRVWRLPTSVLGVKQNLGRSMFVQPTTSASRADVVFARPPSDPLVDDSFVIDVVRSQ